MSPVWGLLLLLALFLLGMPVAYALGISAVVIMYLSQGAIKWGSICMQMVAGLNSFTILAVPLFLLSGKVMNACGVTDRLFNFARALVGRLRGGLGHVNVLASVIFAGMSGTAIADACGLGGIEIKAMEDAGYDKDFACAVTCASSTMGPIIPPSMPLVVYGTITGVSIGALFVAGVLPGIIMALLMMGMVAVISKRRNYPRDAKMTFKQFLRAFLDGILPCMTPAIILLGIYSGIFTPTESAAVVVIYSMLLGLLAYRSIGLKGMVGVFKESVVDSIGICVLIATATLFGNTITKAMIPQTVVAWAMTFIKSKGMFLLVLNLMLILVGMFMETVSSISILTPIIYPLALSFGVSGIQLGIIMVLNLMIGVLSPPFGVVLFAITKIAKLPFAKLVKSLGPWYILLAVSLALISIFPIITEFLPAMMALGQAA